MALAPRYGLGDTATPNLASFRQAAAAPAPPITGKAYVWPHPSGLFNVQIGADGTVGGFVSGPINDPSASDQTKATAQVVGQVWVYPFLHGSGIAAAVTGNEAPDSFIQQLMASFFAFNKGMVDTSSGWQGTNTIQQGAIDQTGAIVTANQPNVAAQVQGQINTASGALTNAINTVPTVTQLLTDAFASLNITGPGVAAAISSATPALGTLLSSLVGQLKQAAAQLTAKWTADLAANPNTVIAELPNDQSAFLQSVQDAISQLQAKATTLAGGSVPPIQPASAPSGSGTSTTATPPTDGGGTPTIADAGTQGATTAPASTAGFSGIAALAIGAGLLLALTRKKKR